MDTIDVMDPGQRAQAECIEWLASYLLPQALAAAQRPSLDVADILAELRTQEDIQRLEKVAPESLFWNEREAFEWSTDLRIVAAAFTVARLARDAPRARDLRDVIAFLAYLDAFEYSNASELAACVPAGIVDREFEERAAAAEKAFERWRSLDAPVGEALLTLVVELARTLRDL